MGCDIHWRVEYRKSEQEPWQELKPVYKFCDKRFYTGRSYEFFALLAGVRNGLGIEPLFADRGLPEDSAVLDLEDIDFHSHSHFLLSEWPGAADPIWEKEYTIHGMAEAWRLELLEKYGIFPEEYCSGTDSPRYVPFEARRKYRHLLHMAHSTMSPISWWAQVEGLEPENVRIVFAFDN